MFNFMKAKTAADTDGSGLKDTPERSGNRRQRNLGKGAGKVHIGNEKEPTLAPDLEALNRQGASLSR